ncbi:MAG: zinc ABC transporter substrate-binding protein [Verrucomicrobiae bacterium]|nr:zinc ABC transporter substrate-binding protein [Verrucomicrobiae bacterium]
MPKENRAVLTSFYPLTYFAEQIAGDRVSVRSLCPPETDPSFWNPSRADLQEFQSASLILLNGAGYEHWAATAALPIERVIVTSRPFEAELLSLPSVIHSHGPGGVHTHSGIDGHTWMDPVLARRQAAEILTALTQRWPVDGPAFEEGFKRLSQEFDALDLAFRELTPGLKRMVIFTSHPAYGYLARRFDWSVTSVPLPPDEAPAPEVWEAVRNAVAAAGPGRCLMLFESEPLPVIRERLQTEWQILPVVFQTCESPPPDGNYFTRMQTNVESLRRVVGQAYL